MHTSVRIRVHCVFRTHDRHNLIPEATQPRRWAYLRGIGENIGLEIMALGGIANHVHVLFALPPTLPLATAVQKLKANSSRWINEQSGRKAFAWQEGYGAFSVSASHVADTVDYIQNQAKHHRRMDFRQEWEMFLRKNGLEVPSLRDSNQ